MAKLKASSANTEPILPRRPAHRDNAPPPPPQQQQPPTNGKTTNLLLSSDSENSDEDEDGGVPLGGSNGGSNGGSFTINEAYARRFEHNKKREELVRLEEKYGGGGAEAKSSSRKRKSDAMSRDDGSLGSESESDSTSEDEDDDAVLATEDLDKEIFDTLRAIKTRDPRVYDKTAVFYSEIREVDEKGGVVEKVEKPMHLRDYQRAQLLGKEEDEEEPRPTTFVEEQRRLQRDTIRQMHDQEEGESDEEFLVPKAKTNGESARAVDLNPANADKDPETFLSNFMASRAWIPDTKAHLQPFESDDEEEEARADAFENAYNMRFEDPGLSNEKLVTHARTTVSKHSVRKTEAGSRRKIKDKEQERKEVEKQIRDAERARLRRLRLEETEQRLQKIKDAAGLRGKALKESEWSEFLDANWDNDNWETEMSKVFGDQYYEQPDERSDDDRADGKVRKPKWDDDIDINDLVPDFDDEVGKQQQPKFTLSSDEDNNEDEGESSKRPSKKKQRAQERQEQKKEARKQKRRIEELVDDKMALDLPSSSRKRGGSGDGSGGLFHYRETSPTAFGLSPADILMASDSQLNEFAGLKKLAAFRAEDKKRKDRKRLGKKARLRQWRKDTFGREEGPDLKELAEREQGGGGEDQAPKTKKRKRSRKSKSAVEAD